MYSFSYTSRAAPNNRERERERQTDRDRQTDRQTDIYLNSPFKWEKRPTEPEYAFNDNFS